MRRKERFQNTKNLDKNTFKEHTGRLAAPLRSTDEKRAELTAPLLIKSVILLSKSFMFHVFFSRNRWPSAKP